jgi:putative polyhydroxyalkanoate system protein
MGTFQRWITITMPVIDIRRPHAGSMTSTKAAVEHVAKAIAKQYGVDHHWSGDQLHFDRSGVKGRITVARNDVHVRVELGFLMGAMKPLIEREIERQLDEHIA